MFMSIKKEKVSHLVRKCLAQMQSVPALGPLGGLERAQASTVSGFDTVPLGGSCTLLC